MELKNEYEEFLRVHSLQATGEVFASPDYIEITIFAVFEKYH